MVVGRKNFLWRSLEHLRLVSLWLKVLLCPTTVSADDIHCPWADLSLDNILNSQSSRLQGHVKRKSRKSSGNHASSPWYQDHRNSLGTEAKVSNLSEQESIQVLCNQSHGKSKLCPGQVLDLWGQILNSIVPQVLWKQVEILPVCRRKSQGIDFKSK